MVILMWTHELKVNSSHRLKIFGESTKRTRKRVIGGLISTFLKNMKLKRNFKMT